MALVSQVTQGEVQPTTRPREDRAASGSSVAYAARGDRPVVTFPHSARQCFVLSLFSLHPSCQRLCVLRKNETTTRATCPVDSGTPPASVTSDEWYSFEIAPYEPEQHLNPRPLQAPLSWQLASPDGPLCGNVPVLKQTPVVQSTMSQLTA